MGCVLINKFITSLRARYDKQISRPRKVFNRAIIIRWLVIGVPFSIYLLYSMLLRTWIIDDAGISFVYARNLANGFGLVHQPFASPVEGFSNPSWVLLLSPFFVVNLFDPILIPKIISAALIFATFSLIAIALADDLTSIIALIFISLSAPFVIWNSSGLENPLYIFLICLLFTLMVTDRHPVFIGLTAALIGLTRPEGILFAAIYPIDWFIKDRSRKDIIFYLSGLAIVFGAYLLFRYFYFHDILPNTFYAKYSIGLGIILKPLTGLYGVLGIVILPVLVGLITMTIYIIKHRLYSRRLMLAGEFFFFSILIFSGLPSDWMGEYRFATPLVVFAFVYIAILGKIWVEHTRKPYKYLILGLLVPWLAFHLFFHNQRINKFAENPPAPFTLVAEDFGLRFNRLANTLKIENGSILLSDVGGTLYYSTLNVYDLAGLTDPVIARTIGRDRNRLADYVFNEIKPSFIHFHPPWSELSGLNTDPRLLDQYFPIPPNTISDFVRKDLISDVDQLSNLGE